MTTLITGLAWHLHHEILAEWCYDYQGRVDAIKRDKPLSEQATRLRLFQLVKGPLPAELAAARAKHAAARAELAAAWAKHAAAWDKLDAASVKFVAASVKHAAAWAKYDAAWEAAMPELMALHAIECTDCPWDGKTIFPEGRDA